MTPRNCEIVDCGAFYEVISIRIFLDNPLGDFFDSLAIDPAFFKGKKAI